MRRGQARGRHLPRALVLVQQRTMQTLVLLLQGAVMVLVLEQVCLLLGLLPDLLRRP